MAAQLHTAEETGQELFLWAGEFGVNDLALLPDFIANSGYLTLEYPPDQVFSYTRNELEGYVIQTFTNDASLSVLISNEHLAQEFTLSPERHMGGSGGATADDVNFDGVSDFLISLGGERGGQRFYAAFLWDAATKKFIYAPSFEGISAPLVDSEHKVIWGGWDFSFGYCYDAFECLEGEFVNTHRLIGDYPDAWENGAQCTEYALENGEMKEVGRMHFPGTDGVTAVERYIETGTVWPGWSWCSPRAFVRKG